MNDVLAALDMLEARDATRCIVLTGAGTKAFSAGADLSGGPKRADDAVRFRVPRAASSSAAHSAGASKPDLSAAAFSQPSSTLAGTAHGGSATADRACPVRGEPRTTSPMVAMRQTKTLHRDRVVS